MTPPNPRFRPPNPADTDAAAIAARLRDRLQLRRADGGPEALFTPVPLYNRDLSARQAYPGQLTAQSTARAEDMNEIQLRALDGLGRLDADVELLVQRAKIEIASEISRLRRVHDAFVWETSIAPDVPGGADPNPDDLWDVLRRETRARFHAAVDVLASDLGQFWDGPPEYPELIDGYGARLPHFESRIPEWSGEIDWVYRLIAGQTEARDDVLYGRRLRYLRVWLPFCRWPSINPPPDETWVEGSAAEIYERVTGRYDAGALNFNPPPPGTPFYEWLHGGEGAPHLEASFPVQGLLTVPLRVTPTNRPGRGRQNYLDP